MMLSPHPMDHAQKRALQGTNGITGLGLRHIRLLSYTPACFWPDAPRPSSRNPAQNLIRRACIRFTAAAAMMMPEPVADFVSEEHPWNSCIALSLSHLTWRPRDASHRDHN